MPAYLIRTAFRIEHRRSMVQLKAVQDRQLTQYMIGLETQPALAYLQTGVTISKVVTHFGKGQPVVGAGGGHRFIGPFDLNDFAAGTFQTFIYQQRLAALDENADVTAAVGNGFDPRFLASVEVQRYRINDVAVEMVQAFLKCQHKTLLKQAVTLGQR